MPMQSQANPAPGAAILELTVVIPCLNEVATVGRCVDKAVRTMKEHGVAGEVVVADNGSSDGSQAARGGGRWPRRVRIGPRLWQRTRGRHC